MIQTTHRFLGAALAASAITAALFWVMTALLRIEGDPVYPDKLGTVVLNVHVEPAEEPVKTKPRLPILKPVTAPEPLPQITDRSDGPGITRVKHTGPGPIFKEDPDNLSLTDPDGDAVPLVRIPPQYPPRAMARGLEGRVLIEFNISRAGTVEDAKIVAFEPTSVFNTAALEAVRQWRYEPKRVNGAPVAQRGIRIVIPFKKGDHRE